MTIRPNQLLSSFFMLIAIAAGFFFFLKNQSHQMRIHYSLPDDERYEIKTLVFQQFDEKGLLKNTLHTPTFKHDKKTTFSCVTPDIQVTSEDKQTWSIQADKGIGYQEGKKITLAGNVVILEKATATKPETMLKTPKLHYLPHKQYAYTNHTVQVNQSGSHLEAKGLRASLEHQRIQLLGHVKGHYEKNTA